ncbi:MAG: hypothetical protein Q6M04_12055, partial [Thermostichus sp. BF3_bins_97]
VGSKLRAELGLDRPLLLGTAAAPISPDLLRWYHAIGVTVFEGCGLSESTGVATGSGAGGSCSLSSATRSSAPIVERLAPV